MKEINKLFFYTLKINVSIHFHDDVAATGEIMQLGQDVY